jgi:molybdopterin/thiamine biosynthesis adenylyltransferase
MDYSRIQDSVNIEIIKKSHIVVVGAGGSFSLVTSFARCGVGKLTVLDFDTVEETNIVRQGYKQTDIGKFKVDALGKEVETINPEVHYIGITKNFLDMNDEELDAIFKEANLLLFLTDSFKAQSYGNIIALKYNKPAIWAGWYAQSRTAEVFFQVPFFTTACFRCMASSRYIANQEQEVKVSSNSNTIFHSQLLDSFIGMISLAILHSNLKRYTPFCLESNPNPNEYVAFWESLLDENEKGKLFYNFFQFKAHPLGGNKLFDKAYKPLGMSAHNFVSHWQKAEAEIIENGYSYNCPDCGGRLHKMANKIYS